MQKNASSKIASDFEAKDHASTWVPSYNIAPTTHVPVVRQTPEGQELILMLWGLRPAWAAQEKKLPLLHNARSETVATLPSYREAFKTRRCIVPASGYYEWKSGTPKQPWFFQQKDEESLAIAAIWEENPHAGATFSLLTSPPNAEASAIHHRMPVLLPQETWARWLEPSPLSKQESETLLAQAPDGLLDAWPVHPTVGNVRQNSAKLLAPYREDLLL